MSKRKSKEFTMISRDLYAARVRGFLGFNFAIYPSEVVAPMSVVIRDDAGAEIQRWPKVP